MYKLNEEEYYEISNRFNFSNRDYYSWYLVVPGSMPEAIVTASNSLNYANYINAIIAAEYNKQMGLLQEALDI